MLDFDARYRRRVAMTGVGGLEFLLDLAEATMLRGGDGLRLEDGRVVEVVAEPEPLAEIRAADPLALTRVAWHFGNRHLPTEIMPKALRIRRDPVIEAMVEGLGARVIALEAPFNPEGGAYAKAEGGARARTITAMITTITTMITAITHGHDDIARPRASRPRSRRLRSSRSPARPWASPMTWKQIALSSP